MQAWLIAGIAFFYLLVLFGVARFGDTHRQSDGLRSRSTIYPLSLAIYCTSWTFFGSVGLAASSGLEFLAIYIGPILMMTVGFGLLKKIIDLSKHESITSVADFLGARYGKSVQVAAVATVIAVVGTVPYIALQLKAVSASLSIMISPEGLHLPASIPLFGDIAFLIAILLAVFTILFGTRHADATEHQDGLMLAVALESFVKLAAFLLVGVFVTFVMFDGAGDLVRQSLKSPIIMDIVNRDYDARNALVLTLLSFVVFILLPRQFHVAIVENHSKQELNRARWLFPLYLVLINLFVVPIAAAGLIRFGSQVNADGFVLALPQLADNHFVSLFAFIGGLSAGSAMVIVACVALAIMISNHLVLPVYLRGQDYDIRGDSTNMEQQILNIRRTAITVILLLAYTYYKIADNSQALASIGLVSFAAIAQLAPMFFGGLWWRGGNARGAIAGMTIGFVIWGYTLLLPTLAPNGIFMGWEISLLLPRFDSTLSPLTIGVVWSLSFNTAAYVLGSLSRKASPLEEHQAALFVGYKNDQISELGSRSGHVTVVQIYTTLARYLGRDRTDRAFSRYWQEAGYVGKNNDKASEDLIGFSEQLLASAIGSSSSRLVHSLLLQRFEATSSANLQLLDEATEAIQYNRDVLQTAFDQLDQGITVFDSDYRLAFWNKQFRKLLNLPTSIGQAGTPLSKIARSIVEEHRLSSEDTSYDNLHEQLLRNTKTWSLALPKSGHILEIRSSPMPGGGIVIAWHDVTERMLVSDALRDVNETLERRVEERTSDLVRANQELEKATRAADIANESKTRFLAAAGHDLLQSLNAARLYTSTLNEKTAKQEHKKLAGNISRSLESVEEILGALLAISRLDSPDPKINLTNYPIQRIFDQIDIEFRPIAEEKNIKLVVVTSSLWISTDPAYFRRLIQNLVSNAIKYTPTGKVLIGCKRNQEAVFVEIMDTGLGIGAKDQKTVFGEFARLEAGIQQAPGLGLGLSIVERISELLGHPVILTSTLGKGSRFRVKLPRVSEKQVVKAIAKRDQTQKANSLSGLQIICIDNDLDILDGMQGLLRQWGCNVITTVNSQNAIEAMRADRFAPDIALVDYHLDHQTGIEAIASLHDSGYLGIPAILITADRSLEVKKAAEAKGIPILNKPIRPAALRAMLAQAKIHLKAAE